MNWLKRKLQRRSPRKPLAIEGLPKLREGYFFRIAEWDRHDYPLQMQIRRNGFLWGSSKVDYWPLRFHNDNAEMAKAMQRAAETVLKDNPHCGYVDFGNASSMCGDYVSSD